MTDHLKVAAIGDLQLPYTDYRALSLAMTMLKWWKPSNIVAVGDIDDQLEYSRFSDGTTDEFFNQLKANEKENAKTAALIDKANLKNDLSLVHGMNLSPLDVNPLPYVKENAAKAREFYTDLRTNHKKAEIFSCLGNHDIRVFAYLDRKAPEIIDQVTPDFLYDFSNLGIDFAWYDDKPKELFPGVFFHHGATTSSSGAAVRGDIENYNVSLVRGHDHAGGVVYKNYPLANRELFGLAAGHLCDVDGYGLKYTINPAWQMGFGVLHIYGGEVHPQFIHIKSDYTAVLDGKLFQG